MDLLKVSASIYTFSKNHLQSMTNKCIKRKKDKKKKKKGVEYEYITSQQSAFTIHQSPVSNHQILDTKKMLIVPGYEHFQQKIN